MVFIGGEKNDRTAISTRLNIVRVNLCKQRSSMTISQASGFLGTGLVIAGYVPQIHHLIKERCTAGLSLPAFAVWSSASLLFLIHATMIRDVVFMAVQVVNLAAGGIIVAFCKKYDGQVCPLHVGAHAASARERAPQVRFGP
jgi:uncharacterized protein with PQ loop repeat